jgi:hypothetical protein
MKYIELLPFINKTVQVKRKNRRGYSLEQTGVIKALTELNLILEISEGEEKVIEIKTIEKCKILIPK